MNILKLNTIAISAVVTLFSFEVAQAANYAPVAGAAPVINVVPVTRGVPAVALRAVARAPMAKRSILLSAGKAKSLMGDISNNLSGIGYGSASVNDTGESNTFAIGYRQPIRQHWSVDVSYIDQGNVSASIKATPVGGNTGAQTAKDVALSLPIYGSGLNYVALRHIQVSRGVTAQVGVGAFIWSNEREATIDSVKHVEKDRGVNAVAQLGLSFAITRKVSVELSGQRFFMSDDDVDRLSIGISVGF